MTSSLIIYMLQSCFCMLAFYTFYFFVLKNENYHQLNRLYLLFSLFFSLGIPVLDFSINESAPILVETIINIDDQIEGEVSNIFTPSKVEQTNSVSINTLLLVIYLIGVFFFAIRLFINLIKIRRLISNGKQTKIDEFTIIETDKAHPVFSFFNIIFCLFNPFTFKHILSMNWCDDYFTIIPKIYPLPCPSFLKWKCFWFSKTLWILYKPSIRS